MLISWLCTTHAVAASGVLQKSEYTATRHSFYHVACFFSVKKKLRKHMVFDLGKKKECKFLKSLI